MTGDNETEKFIVDRSKSGDKPDKPEEVILNSGKVLQVHENDPDVLIGSEGMQEEQALRQQIVDQREAKKRSEQQQETIEVKNVVNEALPEDAKEKFMQFSNEIEKDVQKYSSEYLRNIGPYLTGDMTTDAYLELDRKRNKYRDELEEKISARAREIRLSGPLVDDIKKYLAEKLSPTLIITPEKRLESLWLQRLRPDLQRFVDVYDELRKRYQAERTTNANVVQMKALQVSLEHAWNEKRDAYYSKRTIINHKSGLTPEEKLILIGYANSVARPEEKIQRREDTLVPVVPRIDTRPVVVPRIPVPEADTPPAITEQSDTNPPSIPNYEADTPPPNPPTGGHVPVELDTRQEVYESKVSEILTQAFGLEYMFNMKVKAGKLTDDQTKTFESQILKFRRQLLELDETADDASQSLDRIELVRLLVELRDRLEKNRNNEPDAAPVSIINDIHDLHGKVRATYAALQHRLTIDQRRELRAQIAQFVSLVRSAELEHSIAHATEHAPLIAHGVLAPERD